jgi:hypothetical protein
MAEGIPAVKTASRSHPLTRSFDPRPLLRLPPSPSPRSGSRGRRMRPPFTNRQAKAPTAQMATARGKRETAGLSSCRYKHFGSLEMK